MVLRYLHLLHRPVVESSASTTTSIAPLAVGRAERKKRPDPGSQLTPDDPLHASDSSLLTDTCLSHALNENFHDFLAELWIARELEAELLIALDRELRTQLIQFRQGLLCL